MDNDKQVRDAHAMLNKLGAPGHLGIASIRERLGGLLGLYMNGKPIPTSIEVVEAQWSREEEEEQARCGN